MTGPGAARHRDRPRRLRGCHRAGAERFSARAPPRAPVAEPTPERFRPIPDFRWHGAEAYGSPGDVRTCERVAGALYAELGASYRRSRVPRLPERLGWAPRVPIMRAIRRDEEAIARRRVESRPAPKQEARRGRRALVLAGGSGSDLPPGAAKTYAPKGQPPIVGERQARDHLSAPGGVTPQGEVHAPVRPKSSDGPHGVELPLHPGRPGADRPPVAWGGSPIHRRAEVKAFVAEAGDAIRPEPLPPYAPDRNPVARLWRHRTEVEMRDPPCPEPGQLHRELHLALGRVRQKPARIGSFFEGAGLRL